MRNRMCVVILLDKNEGCKFIAASLHNLNNREYSIKMAELFLQLLSMVGETTGHPVVVAGDFNANILKSSEVARLGYTVPEYKPTIHRLNHKSPINVTIDFFLYRPGKDGTAVLHSVKAEVARADVVDSKGIIDNKKMDALHKVSNHDPLRATLQLSRTTKVTTKPSVAAAAAATISKRPSSSSKTVIKSSVKVSPPLPTVSRTAAPARVKRESTTLPVKPKSAAAGARVPPKPSQPVKPSASQRVIKSRTTNSAKTKHTHK